MQNPVVFRTCLQPLALFFLLAGACTTPPTPNWDAWIPEGFYHFTCEIVNQNDLARATHQRKGMAVQLLGDFDGGFTFEPKGKDQVEITDSRMNYPGLKRTFRGEGVILSPGRAEGSAISWLKTMGPISRNHREGTWFLRPATPREIEQYQAQQQRLQKYREAVQEQESAS
jgi:hypothetical protein